MLRLLRNREYDGVSSMLKQSKYEKQQVLHLKETLPQDAMCGVAYVCITSLGNLLGDASVLLNSMRRLINELKTETPILAGYHFILEDSNFHLTNSNTFVNIRWDFHCNLYGSIQRRENKWWDDETWRFHFGSVWVGRLPRSNMGLYVNIIITPLQQRHENVVYAVAKNGHEAIEMFTLRFIKSSIQQTMFDIIDFSYPNTKYRQLCYLVDTAYKNQQPDAIEFAIGAKWDTSYPPEDQQVTFIKNLTMLLLDFPSYHLETYYDAQGDVTNPEDHFTRSRQCYTHNK